MFGPLELENSNAGHKYGPTRVDQDDGVLTRVVFIQLRVGIRGIT